MISHNVSLNLLFNSRTESKPIYIYVPFLVDEVKVLDSMYGDDSVLSESTEYTITSQLFNNTIIPLTMVDLYNQALNYNKHDTFTIQFQNRKNINGLYTFTITSLMPDSYVSNFYILLQFVNYEKDVKEKKILMSKNEYHKNYFCYYCCK